MGRFYSDYWNRRGNNYGAMILDGNGVHTRGWDAGAKVTPRIRGDHDEFDVYMTTGSHETSHDVLLGTVTDTPDGPRWTPEPAGGGSVNGLTGALTAALADADLDSLDRETLERLAALRLVIAGKLSAPAADQLVFGSPLAGSGS